MTSETNANANAQTFLLSTDNIMTSLGNKRLPQFIRIKNNLISKANKLKLRKRWNITFKGKTKAEQKISVMNAAQALRDDGKKFKNMKYAYRFLAYSYNEAVEMERKEIKQERERIRILNIKRRKAIKKLTKKLIMMKLKKSSNVMIGEKVIDLITPNTAVNIMTKVLKDEFALLEIVHKKISHQDWDDDKGEYYNVYDGEPVKRFLTLNQMNKSKIANFLTSKDEGEEWEYDDGEYAGDYQEFQYVKITIPDWVDDDEYKNKDGKIKTKNGGGFFRWLNNTEFDLSRYGVYPNVNPSNYKDNCIIKALQVGGLDEDRINLLKSFVINREIPMCKLKKVCEKLNICIRLRKLGSENKSTIYGKGNEEIYEIGLLDKHYFIIEKVDFTMYSLKNYDDLCSSGLDVNNFKNIYKMKNNKYCRANNRFTDSWKAIKYMLENKYEMLLPIAVDENILETQFLDKAFDLDKLEYPEENVMLNEVDYEKELYKKQRSREWTKWYFDFETYCHKVYDENIVKKIEELDVNKKKYHQIKKELEKKKVISIHKPFMVCAYSDDGKRIVATGDNCGKLFMDLVLANSNVRVSGVEGKEGVKKKIMLIAHNCGYDYRFLRKYLFMVDEKTKGNGLMNATGKYMNHKTKEMAEIQFKDSLKLISMPLRAFGKCFNLKIEKEVMPYGLYSRKTLRQNWVDVRAARRYLKSDKEYKQFIKNLKKLKLIEKVDGVNLFDMMKYSEYYCLKDCKVLMKGYETFRGWINKALSIDIDSVWTIASLANKYLELQGVYEGVYKLSGLPQVFIQKCVVGGRTMCRDNVKHKVEGVKMADYDGVSLYPSSMVRMKGTLMGVPKVLQANQLNYNFLSSCDGYFIKIKITRVGVKRHFSLLSEVNENGIRVFHNDMVGKEFYVDMTTLEDWINFQDVDFEVLKGYYYDEGRNPQIRKTLQYLFDKRLEKKKEKNPIQVVYKLIMNASYGKSILKPINTEVKIVDGEKNMKKFLLKYYNYIIEYEKLYDCNKWKFKLHKTIEEHFNNAAVGVEILSMSKRIMNEVMCLAEDENLTAYYQDTDSIHMEWDDVKVLKEKFTEKYNRELDGKQLGQFHIDFDLEDDNGNDCKDVYAEKSIFLGKKCYIDCLVGTNPEGKTIRGHHIRMKGIPNSTIKHTANKMGIDLYELYSQLYSGKRIKFDLLENGKRCNFKFHNSGQISSMNKFVREIGFK